MKAVTLFMLAIALSPIGPAAAQHMHMHNVGSITVMNPWARASAGMAEVGSAYMEVRNNGGSGDRLISASTPAANAAELHTHIMDKNVVKMRRLDHIVVPANGSVELKPGGDHVMMIGLHQKLVKGKKLSLTLTFEKAGRITVPVEIKSIGARGHTSHGKMKHGSHK